CKSRRSRFARRSQVAEMAADLKPDLFHVHEPELLGSVIAAAGSRPVVYDVHESYLDVIDERDWIPHLVKPIARVSWDRGESGLVRCCGGVVTVTEAIAQRYRRLNRNVEIVGNYPDLAALEALPPVTRDGVSCVFAGLLTYYSGLFQMV